MKALVWPVATYGCESGTLRTKWRNTSWRLWGERAEKDSAGFVAAKNEWVLNKAGVKKELLDTVKARKPAYYGHAMRK